VAVARARTVAGYAIPGVVVFFFWVIAIILAIILLNESATLHSVTIGQPETPRVLQPALWRVAKSGYLWLADTETTTRD
jgi:hypothetical protein